MKAKRHGVIALSLSILLGAGLSACGTDKPQTSEPATGAAKGYPVTVSSCGHTFTFKHAPQRVVVGWPTSVDILTALGVGRSVVGYTAGEFGPPPKGVDTKKLSDSYAPSAETILAAKPDLFLAKGDSQLTGESGGITLDDLKQIGAATYVLGSYCKNFTGATSVDTVYHDVDQLGRIFAVPKKAAALIAKLRQRVAAAKAMRGSAKAPRVAYVQVANGKLYALVGLSYAAQLSGVGAVNVFANLKENFGEITPEKVLTLNADDIVYEYGYTENPAAAKASVAKLLAKTKAVRNGKLIGVPSSLAEGPDAGVVDAIELIAKGLYR